MNNIRQPAQPPTPSRNQAVPVVNVQLADRAIGKHAKIQPELIIDVPNL
jgi:hypothetical protein